MPKTFSTEAWARNLPLYEKIMAMPFNAELAAGTLPEDRFRHYMVQDAHYLEGFARALSLASAKGHTADHVVHFAGAAQLAIAVERSLHADYFSKFGITPIAFKAAEPTPVCEHYVSYLLRVAALEPFEVALAALLPCFWDLPRGRQAHPWGSGLAQSLQGLDRYLCRRRVRPSRQRRDQGGR